MVKKGQSKGPKPGGGAGAKKPSPATTGGDDSFIVFSNSDKEPKPKRTLPASAGSTAAGSSTQDGPALAGEVPKRPDVKKLIGGASWTGKLPVNMLSEHCQKQKWEKPEYTMVSRIRVVCMALPTLMCDADENAGRLFFDGYTQSEESEDTRICSASSFQTSTNS